MPRLGITAYDLLISCPGDVSKYIEVINKCVENFNGTLGVANNAQIATKHWSTHSYPQSGDKPQELLNKQFVRDCDAAVAIFWTRFGTPTDKYGSGTEEEIEEMLTFGKQVFMYFIEEPVNPSNIDMEQYKKVNEFREKYKERAIYATIQNDNELYRKFSNDLTMHFLPLMMGEPVIPEKKLKPVLKIYDDSFSEVTSIKHTCLSESKLILDKKQKIINKIESLNKEFLNERDKIEQEESYIQDDTELSLIYAKNEGLILSADISEEWKEKIIDFAQKNAMFIEEEFWNVGNLSISNWLPKSIYGMNKNKPYGTDDEEQRYSDIENLYFDVKNYNAYNALFSYIDNQNLASLILTNEGNTYDEDIDVKLFLKQGSILGVENFMIPEINIIKDVLKMDLFEFVYMVETNDAIDEYSGYPIKTPPLNLLRVNPLNKPSVEDQYLHNKTEYKNMLEDLFYYKFYKRGDVEVVSFHVDYLKHNTSMTFPSVLVFENVPEVIEYEITSKHTPEIIKGKITLV